MLPWTAWLPISLLAMPPVDTAQLEAHLDEHVAQQMQQSGVPGVVVSVVQGDRVLLAKGWGHADRENDIPMDGQRTVVRVASISKTFTASVVAQLEDDRRLDVDAPVDDYLPGYGLPPRFDSPATLRHLLSHSSGIINNNVGRVSRDAPAQSFADFLAETMPPALRPPGVAIVYSNHGNALAGLVVEQVTGVPFADHADRALLTPLRMDSSSFVLTPEIESALAVSYVPEGGELRPQEYLHFKTVPASALHTTAADMAHYMIMHLSEGRFEGQPVLGPEAMRRMTEPVAALDPALPTYHYAFAHARTEGHPTRSHGGSVPAFLSRLVLFDEHDFGVFVCQNSLGTSIGPAIVESIAEHFLPPPSIPEVVPDGDGRPEDPGALAGHYRKVSKTDTPAFTRGLALLLEKASHVSTDAEGFLTVDGERFVRTGPHVFMREREGKAPEAVVFVTDESGQGQWLHRGLSSSERRPWYAAPFVQLPALALAWLLLLVAAVRRRGLVRAAAGLALVGVTVPYLYVAWVDAGQVAYLRPLRFGMPPWLEVVRALLPVGAILAWIGAGKRSGNASRVPGIAVAVASTGLILWLWLWSVPAPGLLLQ
ncbi:MAG: serine hydrolase [Myxococcota bacterium]